MGKKTATGSRGWEENRHRRIGGGNRIPTGLEVWVGEKGGSFLGEIDGERGILNCFVKKSETYLLLAPLYILGGGGNAYAYGPLLWACWCTSPFRESMYTSPSSALNYTSTIQSFIFFNCKPYKTGQEGREGLALPRIVIKIGIGF